MNALSYVAVFCILGLAFGEIRYSIPEELNNDAFVGNIANDLGLNVESLSKRRFRIVSVVRKQYLGVNLQNGVLFVNARIDREQLCGANAACFLRLEAVIENPLESFQIEVEILDINDNAPGFERSEQHIEIPETAAPGTRFLLDSAQDPDVGTNSLNTYLLSPNDYFSLDVQTGSDHGKLAELVLKTNLDREKQAAYKLVLTALDGGSPVLSGTTLIKITVLDSNDNMPIFDHTIYRVSVLENVLKGTLIIRLNATDADEGANGEVMYNFRRRTPKKVLELFKLEPNTGEIRVQGVIDFEENNVYEMIVEAKDKGASAVPVHCKVVVTVLDMNDNAPQVILTSLSSPIPEDAPPGTVVALITVTDQESEENGEVRCQIQHDVPFQLNSSSKNSYTLVTRYSLDREASSHYSVVISCRDLGLPPLVTNKTIQVEVSDINDNAPHFAHRSFTAYVTENTHPGSSIFSVTAFDLDKHRNAHLSYSILHTEVKGAPVFDYVSINSESGIIFSQNSFDYEQLKNFQVGVQVQDGGDPPLTANVTVNVVILDQNDNAPLIVSPIPMDGFDAIISPSVDLGYQVTKIIATDADSGQNARLSYQLLDATQPGVFNVISNSGEIRTTRRLDDLKDTVHRLVIMVKDSGHPSLSATGTVSLSIIDGGAEMLSDFSGNVPKSTDSSDLAFYIIISLGSISCVLLVTIIALVTTICHNDSRSSSVCCFRQRNLSDTFQNSHINLQRAHNSELVSNFMEVRGTGSLSRTYCYKVHSASESGKGDLTLQESAPATLATHEKTSAITKAEWNGKAAGNWIKIPIQVGQLNTDWRSSEPYIASKISSQYLEENLAQDEIKREFNRRHTAITSAADAGYIEASPDLEDGIPTWAPRYGSQQLEHQEPDEYQPSIYMGGSPVRLPAKQDQVAKLDGQQSASSTKKKKKRSKRTEKRESKVTVEEPQNE
uniref:Protocadherin mu1 n=1 Tax=Callorhinchus milii TaxID=7868 RepID=B0YN77_CALMI|nr:protocadherin mu1 [Callorhinchus milii]